jgi:hypothetical protein
MAALFPEKGTLFPDKRALFYNKRTLFYNKRTLFYNKRTLFPEKRTLIHEKGTLFYEKDMLFPKPCCGHAYNKGFFLLGLHLLIELAVSSPIIYRLWAKAFVSDAILNLEY